MTLDPISDTTSRNGELPGGGGFGVARERAAELLEVAMKIDAGDSKRKKDIDAGAPVDARTLGTVTDDEALGKVAAPNPRHP